MSINFERLAKTLTAVSVRELGGENGHDYVSEAEDISQEAIIKLLDKDLSDEDDAFKLGAKIVADLCKDLRRIESNRREIESEYGASINRTLTGQSAELLAADPLDLLIADEVKDRLEELSPLLRATLELHHMDGLSVSAIAEMQGKSEVAIYKRLEAAKAYLEDKQPEEVCMEEARPSMEDIIQQQKDSFKRGDEAYTKRRVRRENPGATLAQWEAMYGC